MTPQQRLDYLLETVATPTNVGVNFSQIGDTINGLPGGPAAPETWLDKVVGTIQQAANQLPSLGPAYAALSSETGLLLSNPQRQSQIDVLAVIGEWPDAVRDAIKSLGVTTRFRWQIAGHATEPTLAQVTVEIEAEQDATRKQNWKQRFEAALNKIGTIEQAAGVAEVIAIADEMGPVL